MFKVQKRHTWAQECQPHKQVPGSEVEVITWRDWKLSRKAMGQWAVHLGGLSLATQAEQSGD